MSKRFPTKPAKPGRVCWGCDRYCAVDELQCGNGSVATPHPSELFGEDWLSWGLDAAKPAAEPVGATPAEPSGNGPG